MIAKARLVPVSGMGAAGIAVCMAVMVHSCFGQTDGLAVGQIDDPAKLAARLLDSSFPEADKLRLIAEHAQQAAEIIHAMTQGMSGEPDEMSRRIPWIWRVAIECGKRGSQDEIPNVLNVSLPHPNETLEDWQAVVVGGGIVNGLSIAGEWPAARIGDWIPQDSELQTRWRRTIGLSYEMAKNSQTSMGTRYDALRIIAMDQAGAIPALQHFLQPETHDELQMGAVSGLSDVREKEVAGILLKCLKQLSEGNRGLAVQALIRTSDRAMVLLLNIQSGDVPPEWLTAPQIESLKNHADAAVKSLAQTVLGTG